MSIWVEIHCDIRKDKKYPDAQCYTNENLNPCGMSYNTQKEVNQTINFISEIAIKQGWIKKRGIGWICPSCQK